MAGEERTVRRDEVETTRKIEADIAQNGPVVFPLRTIIQAHGDDVKELKFREPTAKDIITCGYPIVWQTVGKNVQILFDEEKMTEMMSALAAVPRSAITMLHPKDWASIAMRLSRFFMPD